MQQYKMRIVSSLLSLTPPSSGSCPPPHFIFCKYRGDFKISWTNQSPSHSNSFVLQSKSNLQAIIHLVCDTIKRRWEADSEGGERGGGGGGGWGQRLKGTELKKECDGGREDK